MNYFKQIIFIVVLLMLLILVIRMRLVINDQNEKLEELKSQVSEIEKENESLKYELSKPLDEEGLRDIAEENGYRDPGEQSVLPING